MSEREERMQKFKDAAANEERMNQLVNDLRDEQLELRERRKDMEIRAAEREAREADEKAKNREQVRVRSEPHHDYSGRRSLIALSALPACSASLPAFP